MAGVESLQLVRVQARLRVGPGQPGGDCRRHRAGGAALVVGEQPDAGVPVVPVRKDVDERIDEPGAPEDDVAGHVKAGVSPAWGHRVEDHQDAGREEASHVAQANE